MVRKLLHIQNMDCTENNSSHGNDRKVEKSKHIIYNYSYTY